MDSSFNLNNRSINGTSPSTDLGNTDNNTQELGTDQSFIGVPDNNDGYNINQLFIDGDFTEDYQQRIMERDVIGSTQRQQPPQQQQQQQQPGLITEVGIGQQYSDLSAEYLLEIEYFTQDTYNQLVDLDENGYQKRLNGTYLTNNKQHINKQTLIHILVHNILHRTKKKWRRRPYKSIQDFREKNTVTICQAGEHRDRTLKARDT